MKNLFSIILICLPSLISAQSEAALITNVYNRATISLDGKWHYIIDPYENGYYNYRREAFDKEPNPGGNAYFTNKKAVKKTDRIEYDFAHAPTLLVPGSWNVQADELRYYEGTVWYQRDFSYDKKADKKVFLYFGAANYETHVYLNGEKIGTHIGGFTPFNFEVTQLLKDGDNFIVVKVDNTRYKEVWYAWG